VVFSDLRDDTTRLCCQPDFDWRSDPFRGVFSYQEAVMPVDTRRLTLSRPPLQHERNIHAIALA
jgi:hypothetical protein